MNSSSQRGCNPVLTFVRATLTLFRATIIKGFGTSLYGNLCASRICKCSDRSSRKRATFGARVNCETHNGFKALIQSEAFSEFGAAKYVTVDKQGRARSTSWKQ